MLSQAKNLTILNDVERAYYTYKKTKVVSDLLIWFKAELALEPEGYKNNTGYSDEYLRKHTRHVENLARQWHKNRTK